MVDETQFYDGQSSKGNHSKSVNARVMVLAPCTLSNNCMKSCKDSLNGFQFIVRTQLRHDFVKDKVPREIT